MTHKVWKVFVVDDYEAIARAVRRTLNISFKEQVDVRVFLSPVEALAAMDDSVDILITDYQMPDMDGPTLIVSARHVAPSLRALLMSGDDGSLERLTQAAHDDPGIETIMKPFDQAVLVAKVTALMT